MSGADVGRCPCGGGRYADCCGPLHAQQRLAATPEELMRSRYSAYALRLDDHVFRTWHPRTRPDDVTTSPDLTWTGLEVLGATRDGDAGTVEFVARYRTSAGDGHMHERSIFERRAGRWLYVTGEVG